MLKKNEGSWDDKVLKALSEAIADVGYRQAIPLLLAELSKLETNYGKYPNSIVKKKSEYHTSGPTGRSVGDLTLALGRLGVPEVKTIIKRILKHPIDTVSEEVDIFSTEYLLSNLDRNPYDRYGSPTKTTWTITYNPWTLYQATRAAGAYEDQEFVDLLKRYLRHENAVVRYGAITALARYAPHGYREGFASCLADKDPLVRDAAVRAEGRALVGATDARAIAPVMELMGDENDSVRAV